MNIIRATGMGHAQRTSASAGVRGKPKSRHGKGGCEDLHSTVDHHQMRTRREGSKIPKILRTSFMYGPLLNGRI